MLKRPVLAKYRIENKSHVSEETWFPLKEEQ
jgi:hypothetical protein